MKIYRQGLILTCGEVIPSEGSQNVPIQLINDDTFTDYDKEIAVSYLYDREKTLLEFKDGSYILPLNVFAQCGIIGLAVKLVKGDEIQVTKKIALKVDDAPNTSKLVPLEEDWETVVNKYLSNKTYTKDEIDKMGLSVVNGMLCMTFKEGENQ